MRIDTSFGQKFRRNAHRLTNRTRQRLWEGAHLLQTHEVEDLKGRDQDHWSWGPGETTYWFRVPRNVDELFDIKIFYKYVRNLLYVMSFSVYDMSENQWLVKVKGGENLNKK